MLLDIYVLKKGFEELLTVNSPPNTAIPTGYIKRVAQSMSRLDPILKTLQVRPSPPEALVQAYLIHIADKSDVNFRKILELKGIVRKQDQSQLQDLFQAHRASPRNDALPQSSAYLTPVILQSSGVGAAGNLASGLGSISTAASVSTSNLHARFDPTTFGNAIISAARDGVDRLGTPVLGGSSNTPSGVSTPAPQQQQLSQQLQQQQQDGKTLTATSTTAPTVGPVGGNLNEISRGFGKLFRRDMSSFGARFGTGSTAKNGEEG